MTERSHRATPNIFPALRYDNAPAAIEWLVKAFGFEKQMIVPGPDGSIAHAQLKLGPGVIMLGSAREDGFGWKPPRALGGVNQAVYVHVKDVDAHYARARAAGARIIKELAETPYGSREYLAADPEGHLWGFGTYEPGSAEQAE